MPTLLRLRLDGPQWPYSVAQLRQDHPSISFCATPTAEDLAPFDVFWVEESPQPAHDPRTERIEAAEPAWDEQGWRQQWRIRPATPEEVAAYDDANRPDANWPTFKAYALTHRAVNAAIAAAIPVAPAAALALPAALLRAEQGDVADFHGCWSAVLAAVPVPPAAAAELIAMAERCHLPQAFLDALSAN